MQSLKEAIDRVISPEKEVYEKELNYLKEQIEAQDKYLYFDLEDYCFKIHEAIN